MMEICKTYKHNPPHLFKSNSIPDYLYIYFYY
jgi:hypothetical protein